MTTLLMGIDVGTSTTRAIAYDPTQGRVVATSACPTPTYHPQPEYSEHDPAALWDAVVSCLRSVLTQVNAHDVHSLAISSLGEAGLPLNDSDEPLYPIIAWYDRRCEPQVARWEQHFSQTQVHAITGQAISTSLGVYKWLWLRDHAPSITAQTAHWLSLQDYLYLLLTGKHATSPSIAARTNLSDQRSFTWSEELLDFAGRAPRQLPPILPAASIVGTLTQQTATSTGLLAGTPCVFGGHDHLCAAFTAGGYQAGVVIDSTGTAQSLMLIQPTFQSNAQIVAGGYACSAHVLPNTYVLRGGLKAAGGAIEWLTSQLAPSQYPLPYAALEELAETGVGRRVGPLWLPHLIGSGPPEGDRHSQGALVGLRIEHDQGDLFRSLLEALAYWLRHNLNTMTSFSGQTLERVMLLGGTTRLRLLARLKAALLKMPVTMPDIPEPSAVGAALLAGLGTGVFSTPAEAVATLRYGQSIIAPDLHLSAWYDRLYETCYSDLYETLRNTHHRLAQLSAEMTVEEGRTPA